MNRYELTYIIDASLEETARKELIEKFSQMIRQNGGEVEKVDETWGKRRLAYPINDMLEGYYVLVTFSAEGNLPREIERNLEISDSVLRYLIIKLLNKKQSVKPRPVRVAPPAPAPEETPVKEEVSAVVVEVEAAPAAVEAVAVAEVEAAPVAVEEAVVAEEEAAPEPSEEAVVVEETVVSIEEEPAPVGKEPAAVEEAAQAPQTEE